MSDTLVISDDPKETILVVDDLPAEGSRLKNFLIENGYNAVWTANVEKAVAAAEKIKPHAVVADVHLGSNDTCLEVVEFVRKHQPLAYVVCYSGVNGSAAISEAEKWCDIFLPKPFEHEKLIYMLHQGIENRYHSAQSWLKLNKKNGNGVNAHLKSVDADPNFASYLKDKKELLEKYRGHYVAYIDGRQVGIFPSKEVLFESVVTSEKRTDIFYKQITVEESILRFRSPRKSRVAK